MSGHQRKAPHNTTRSSTVKDSKRREEVKNDGQGNKTSSRVPVDVVMHILNYYAALSPSCAVNALLISKEFKPTIEEGVYGCISLFSIRGMESFLQLIKGNPRIAKKVNALWIAPGKSDSDLISALTPSSANPAMEIRQKKVQQLAREILRSCRKLRHLALDGGFVTPQSASSFGTACKPLTLLCVNPHSFLGNFSAPMFRLNIQRLEIVDTTLAVEEIDEIRQMQDLKKFIWTSPRAKADVTRDVSVLLRILSPRARDLLLNAASENEDDAGEDAIPDFVMQQQQRMMEVLTINGTALPEKARANDKLQSICTATSQARAAALAATFKKIVEEIEVGKDVPIIENDNEDDDDDDDVSQLMESVKQGSFYVDSSRANSSSIHPPSGVELQTRALSSLMQALSATSSNKHQPWGAGMKYKVDKEVPENAIDGDKDEDDEDDDDDEEIVDEWEALRDLVCQRKYSTSTPLQRYFANVGSGNAIWSGGSYIPSMNSSGHNSALSGSGTNTPRHGGEDEIDGGKALQRIWHRWLDQVAKGELERDL